MLALALAVTALNAAPAPIGSPNLPTTPEGWRAAAAEDLIAVHDILRDNDPAMVVSRDSAQFRQWLERGLAEAREGLPKVKDFRGYYYVMEGYVRGFRDGHISLGNRNWPINQNIFAWPGFMVGWRHGGYEVTYSSPQVLYAPAKGARLVACDDKTAEVVARSHDRYDGNLDLASERYYSAALLFADRGNPFISRPNTCVFSFQGLVRSFSLTWAPVEDAELDLALAATLRGTPGPKLGLQPWGARRWWITVPSMDAHEDWNGFYDNVRAHLTDLRSARVLVIDIRQNAGGDSGFGKRLARLLWGDALIDARGPILGPTVWRVSRLNRENWAREVHEVAVNPEYGDDRRTAMKHILSLYDSALAHGDPTFTAEDDTPTHRPKAVRNPVQGRVVILTDYACASACLDFMDQAMAMPGVVQAGTPTSADTIFMEVTHVPELPSGLSWFNFPHKAWVKRPRGSNVPYVPSEQFTWRGDLDDEAGLRQWLGEAVSQP